MQYRHGFHAGNFADVHKHVALLALIDSLQRKAKGFLYLDTHAGGGLYDLRGEQARRSGESEGGIARLPAEGTAAPRSSELAAYFDAVARLRAVTGATTYPGSPLLAAAALRDVDRAICFEVIAQEARHLTRALDAIAPLTRGTLRVEAGDGYGALAALLPPRERRALVLIDPPFESGDDLARLVEVLPEALRRFESGVYAVWFPVKRQRDADLWLAKIQRVVEQPTLVAQLWLHPRDTAVGLNGSGLLIVNPPWQIDVRLSLWQEELRERLGGDADSGSDVKWLVHERT